MDKISVVVVNYKNSEFTENLCKSLSAQKGVGIDFKTECVIVDNSCCEDEFIRLSGIAFGNIKIKLVRSNANLGYFGGLNEGLDAANGNFIILGNNDLYFNIDFCQNLLATSYQKNVFAVAPNVINLDGDFQNPHLRVPMSFLQKIKLDFYFSNFYVAKILKLVKEIFFSRRNAKQKNIDSGPIHLGIGACYILLPQFLARFKKLSYPHFLYGEEAYFSKQIHDAGGVLWFDSALVVKHHESATTSEMPRIMMYNYARDGYSDYRNFL